MESNSFHGGPPSSKLSPLQSPKSAIIDLFNLYLGRYSKNRVEETYRGSPNKLQKRITAIHRELPPSNEQFVLDFELLQAQFADKEQVRTATEIVLVTLCTHLSSHAPHADFLRFAIRSLCVVGYVNWDSILVSLLSTVTSAGQGASTVSGASGLMASPTVQQSSNFQAINGISPLTVVSTIGSPSVNAGDSVSNALRFSENGSTGQPVTPKSNPGPRAIDLGSLHQLSCKIITEGLESNLKPATYADIFSHMLNWLVHWDQHQHDLLKDSGMSLWNSENDVTGCIHSCLDVVLILVDESKCRIPFYELLRNGLQFLDNIPDDEALFTIILEIHRRRDMVAMHMQMLDQHLHCPTFATPCYFSQSYPVMSGDSLVNVRSAPITYPSVLGEPLHGEEVASLIPKESMDWERALRCLRHALHSAPSPDWWRRVVVIAPCYRQLVQQQGANPSVVFSTEMICDAIIDRTVELLKNSGSGSESNYWLEWLKFGDIIFLLVKNCHIDFIDFVDKLSTRLVKGGQQILRSNHVTWLLTQLIRIDTVSTALSADPNKVETIRKIISLQREEHNSDMVNPRTILLDYISSSQSLRIWSYSPNIRDSMNPEQIQKGKQIEEWWRPYAKGERMMDFLNMDDRSLGMFWVLSHTMVQASTDAVITWLNSSGVTEFPQSGTLQSNERHTMMHESCPLSMTFLSGVSINLLLSLYSKLDDFLFNGQVIPSISMVETYVRVILTAPYSVFRLHFTTLQQKAPTILSQPGVSLLLLEVLNYRLIPLYRYNGRTRNLLYDIAKAMSLMKVKHGEHRPFRLAENLCMNLILSLRDSFSVKRDIKEPSDFTETLNRVCVMSFAILSKTRGIAEVENILYVQPLLEQMLAKSQHTWSEKTLRFFPPLIREYLLSRIDKHGQVIQAWQQVESAVINQCTQLLSPQADPSNVITYLKHSFPQHRKYLCAGAWMLMNGHPDNINSANLARVLREFCPEEVTLNIYTMVDLLLHHIQVELQHGHLIQDLLFKASANFSFFIWTHELLPLDVVLLALADRDDDPHALRLVISLLLDRQEFQQRVKSFCMNRGLSEHWLNNGPFKRIELQKALGNHLAGKDRYPPFFDDIAARMLPIIPLILYRLIENDVMDSADRLLATYSPFLAFYPLRFTFVREILAYFYGHIPNKLVFRILNVLDLSKVPFSDAFPQYIGSSNPSACPPDYFFNLLVGLVNNVIPPVSGKSRTGSLGDAYGPSSRVTSGKGQSPVPASQTHTPETQKAFYQNQDPGNTQVFLETAAIELLSLPVPASRIVSSLVQIVVHIQPFQSYGMQTMAGGANLPTSPSGGSTDSLSTSRSNSASSGNVGTYASKLRNGSQSPSCLMIQACGLLLAQLPQVFHSQLYLEAARIIKECWWLTDVSKTSRELDSAVGYALWDPTWAAQDSTSTTIGNTVALLHAFFSNLPLDWIEGSHIIVKHLKPITSVPLLRIVFRILAPLLPRVSQYRPLFVKTLATLLNILTEAFGRGSQALYPVDVKDISDIIDFLHHAVLYEGQGPGQGSSKPKADSMALCAKAYDLLRPELQHVFGHLRTDPNASIYAAHPKFMHSAA